MRSANIPSNTNSPVPEATVNTPGPRRGIKIRSPRRTEPPTIAPAPVVSQSSVQTTTLISTVTPAALVVAKPLESQHTLTLPSQASSNVQQLLPAVNIVQFTSIIFMINVNRVFHSIVTYIVPFRHFVFQESHMRNVIITLSSTAFYPDAYLSNYMNFIATAADSTTVTSGYCSEW